MSIRSQSDERKSKSERKYGHLRIIDAETQPEPLLTHACFHCVDSGIELSTTPGRDVHARPCTKCALSADSQPRWMQKMVEADHINKAKISLKAPLNEILREATFLIENTGLSGNLRQQLDDLHSAVSKPGPKTPVSEGDLSYVHSLAAEGKLWAGKLDEGETSCPHLLSRIPALFRPETRGRATKAPRNGLSRGWHGEMILVRPDVLTTAHQRIILALTHIHHEQGFHSNRMKTTFREVLRTVRKKFGGRDIDWLREKLNEIQSCHLTIVNNLGGIYGTTRNTITTANAGRPILTWEEQSRGLVVTWEDFYLVQYQRHLYSRIDLDAVLALPPVAQLIFVFLASHANDAFWIGLEKWMNQLGFEENKKSRETFRLAIQSLERARAIHPGSIIERSSVWILLTRGVNYNLPAFAPEEVKLKAAELVMGARRVRLASDDDKTPWGKHAKGVSQKKAEQRAGATAKIEEITTGEVALSVVNSMRRQLAKDGESAI